MTVSPIRTHPTQESPRGRYSARVVSNEKLCTDHFRLRLALEHFPASRAGQFVQMDCRAAGARLAPSGAPVEHVWPASETPPTASVPLPSHLLDWSDPDFSQPRAYLRRPFSIAGRRDLSGGGKGEGGGVEIDIIHRVVGKGTRFLEHVVAGEEVSLLGPLGNGFSVPAGMGQALLVGGGVGIPPMIYLAEALRAAGIGAVAIVGAQRRELIPLTFPPGAEASREGEAVVNAEEFGRLGVPTVITTDDGSWGMKGFVTGALKKMLEAQRHRGTVARRGETVVFCCGPTVMMKATAAVCAEFGVACQVSLEQPMACGMGTCQSCVVKWKGKGMEEWVYKLTCTDGPVFDAAEIVW